LENTFVVNQEGVCQVLDFSSEGVLIGCINERKFPAIWTVDIVNNTGVHIWDLPIKTIWAEKNDNNRTSSIHAVKIGARFHENLTPEHLSALSQLLEFIREDSL
jgi:hypothetical protein